MYLSFWIYQLSSSDQMQASDQNRFLKPLISGIVQCNWRTVTVLVQNIFISRVRSFNDDYLLIRRKTRTARSLLFHRRVMCGTHVSPFVLHLITSTMPSIVQCLNFFFFCQINFHCLTYTQMKYQIILFYGSSFMTVLSK